MKSLYLSDSRPWVVGFSGGKDSTCTLQFVYLMLQSIPKEKRFKEIFVLSSDTMVEAPVIGLRQKKVCRIIKESIERDDLPMIIELLRPEISDTFWVNIIGRGYPSPNKWFRWCTDRLKIKPMNKYILNHIKKNGEVLIIIGARKSESASRSQTMTKHEINNSKLRKHSNIKGAFIYTPIEDFSESDVWTYLNRVPSPWGDDNKELKSMYQKKDDEEIAFIVDTDSPPSGHSRFGCWTCTVVEEDKALKSLIKDGHSEYVPLLEFRNKLKRIRDDPECREDYRKNQRVDKFVSEYTGVQADKETHRNFEVLGPFKLKVRHELLKELLQIQSELHKIVPDVELISPEEIRAIELLWIYDGDTVNSHSEDGIDSLIDRLLIVEKDMSDLSKRVGVYKKIEKIIMEYTMNDMLKESLDRGEWCPDNK